MKNNKFIKVRIKNRTCYYLGDIIKFEDFDFDNILINEKSNENILIYNISYRALIGPKQLRIRFDRIDGFIRVYNGTRHLVLFGPEKYDAIYILHKFFLVIMQELKLIHLPLEKHRVCIML